MEMKRGDVVIAPSGSNGLRVTSEVMVDKIAALKRDRIAKTIGRVTETQMRMIERALLLCLDIDASRNQED
jgi:mRNA interferase MazF